MLTLAQGSLISWINYDVMAVTEKTLTSYCRDRGTRVYTPYYVINPSDVSQTTALTAFIEGAYPHFPAAVDKWNFEHVYEQYIAAKSESTVIEGRGIGLVVCIEMLKAQYLLRHNKERVISESLFDSRTDKRKGLLLEALKQVFDDVEVEKLEIMLKNRKSLNYYPFRQVLTEMCKEVGLEITKDDVGKTVDLRNKLVHEGYYVGKKEDHKVVYSSSSKYGDAYQQYFFLDDLVGRFLLATLGVPADTLQTYAGELMRRGDEAIWR